MTAAEIVRKVRDQLLPHIESRFSDAYIYNEINRGLEDFCTNTFALVKTVTFSSEISKRDYDLPIDFLDAKNIFWNNKPLKYRSEMEMNNIFSGSSFEMSRTGTPVIYWFPLHGRFALHPLPDEKATVTTASPNTATSAAAATFFVDSTSGFNESGFILLSDSSEVAHYFAKISTQFRAIIRGEEETTKQALATGFLATERNIQLVYYATDKGVSAATDTPQLTKEYHSAIADYAISELLAQFPNENKRRIEHRMIYEKIRQEAKGDVKRKQKTNLARVRNTFFNDGDRYY